MDDDCDGVVDNGDYPEEICNNQIDDDCDGEVDEGCVSDGDCPWADWEGGLPDCISSTFLIEAYVAEIIFCDDSFIFAYIDGTNLCDDDPCAGGAWSVGCSANDQGAGGNPIICGCGFSSVELCTL